MHWTECDSAVDCWDMPHNKLPWPTSTAYFTVLARYLFIEPKVVNGSAVRTLVCCRYTHLKGAESVRGPYHDVIRTLEQSHRTSLTKTR